MQQEQLVYKFDLNPNFLETTTVDFLFDVEKLSIFHSNDFTGVEFTYSLLINGVWSVEKDIANIEVDGSSDKIKLYIKNTNQTNVSVEFEITITYLEPTTVFTNNTYTNNTQLSTLGELAVTAENNMNMFINTNAGICVVYYRTVPTSQDVIMREYHQHKYVENNQINIITEDNKFPTLEDADSGEWGSQYNTFDAEIDDGYFKSIFGCDTIPRDKDFIFIKESNSLFTLYSSVLRRGVNGKPTTWLLTFGEYEHSEDTSNRPQEIEDAILPNTDAFEPTISDEYEDVVNLRDNMSQQIYRDLNREYVSDGVIFGDHSYTMFGGVGDAVGYKSIIDVNEFSIVFGCTIFDTTDILYVGNDKIEFSTELVVFGFNTGFNIKDNKHWFVINKSKDSIKLQVLENTPTGLKEVYVSSLTTSVVVGGSVKLVFGQYDFEKLRIYNKIIPRELSARIISAKITEKSSNLILMDNCDDINVNPRAMGSNYKPD